MGGLVRGRDSEIFAKVSCFLYSVPVNCEERQRVPLYSVTCEGAEDEELAKVVRVAAPRPQPVSYQVAGPRYLHNYLIIYVSTDLHISTCLRTWRAGRSISARLLRGGATARV